jgi:Divergent InlB B-repeat domain
MGAAVVRKFFFASGAQSWGRRSVFALAAAAFALSVLSSAAAASSRLLEPRVPSGAITGGTANLTWTQGHVDDLSVTGDVTIIQCSTSPNCTWSAAAGVMPAASGDCPSTTSFGTNVFWSSPSQSVSGTVTSGPRDFALNGASGQRVCLYFTWTRYPQGGGIPFYGVSLVASKLLQQFYTLTVSLNGLGQGSVTGSGMNCQPTCSATYPVGGSVSLTATANPGSKFAGWHGGGCSGTGACTVTMNSDQSVIATFDAYPTAAITGGTIDRKHHRATFKFKATGATSFFVCALAKQGKKPRFASCKSPKVYTQLKPGKYVFKVRARSPAILGPVAKRRFTI